MILRALRLPGTRQTLRAARAITTRMSAAPSPAYRLSPLPLLGAEVHGVALQAHVTPEVVEAIKRDVHK